MKRFLCFLLSLLAVTSQGQQVTGVPASQLPVATNALGRDLMVIYQYPFTNRTTRQLAISNLLTSLSQLPGWNTAIGGAAATNVYELTTTGTGLTLTTNGLLYTLGLNAALSALATNNASSLTNLIGGGGGGIATNAGTGFNNTLTNLTVITNDVSSVALTVKGDANLLGTVNIKAPLIVDSTATVGALTVDNDATMGGDLIINGTAFGDGGGLTNLPITSINQLSNSLYFLTNSLLLGGVTNWPPAVSNLVSLSSNYYVGTFTGNGSGITNLSQSILTNLNYTSQYYTNMAGKRSAVTNQFRVINVLDYMGYRNTGVQANDSVAFQMALDATTNSEAGVNLTAQDAALAIIYVPEGTYYFDRPLWFRRWGTKLVGAGQTRTRLNFVNTTTNMFGFLPTASSGSTPTTWLYGIGIEGIYASSFATTAGNRSTFLKLSSVLPPSEDFIGGDWTFKDIQLENFYRGFDLRFFNMALFEHIRFQYVNTAYWFDTPQNAVINMGQVFGGRSTVNGANPTSTNLFGPNAEPSVAIMITNTGFSGASMGVTTLGWEVGDVDSAVRAYQGMISVFGGNFERMHTNVFELHLSSAGYFVNNRMGHMAGGGEQPYFDFFDNTAARSTIAGSVEYGNDSTYQIRVHTNGAGGRVHYTGRMVSVTNAVEAINYLVPFATNRVVLAAGSNVTITTNQAGPITLYTVASTGGGGGGGPFSGGFTNGSGAITADGHAMELIDPNTGWTNLNWTDQTLSRNNTNVLDWFNKRLIGPWTIDGATFGASIINISNATTGEYTEIQPGSVFGTNVTGSTYLLTNGTFYGTVAYPTNLAFAGHTNVFLLNNNYADLVAESDVAVTNVGLALGGYYKWGTLVVSNSQATNITVRTYSNAVAPLRIQGASSTNALVIGPGKEGFLSYHIRDVKSTNYVTTSQQ